MTTEFSTEFSAGGAEAPSAPTPVRTINIKRMFRLRAKLMIIVFCDIGDTGIYCGVVGEPGQVRGLRNPAFCQQPSVVDQ